MRTDAKRSNIMGQARATAALVIAVVALVVAIWAWTRADPGLSAEIENRAAEVRQEMSQQVDALQVEIEDLRQQIFVDDAEDDAEDDEPDEEDDEGN